MKPRQYIRKRHLFRTRIHLIVKVSLRRGILAYIFNLLKNPISHLNIGCPRVLNWISTGKNLRIFQKQRKMFERTKEGNIACVSLNSTTIYLEIGWSMKYYDKKGIWAHPLHKMRPYLFNVENLKIPKLVLRPKLLSLGVGTPLHPYIDKILKWYDVALIQLFPNSYKLAWALFMMYHDCKLGAPPMNEFSFFFSIRKFIPDYYLFVVNK